MSVGRQPRGARERRRRRCTAAHTSRDRDLTETPRGLVAPAVVVAVARVVARNRDVAPTPRVRCVRIGRPEEADTSACRQPRQYAADRCRRKRRARTRATERRDPQAGRRRGARRSRRRRHRARERLFTGPPENDGRPRRPRRAGTQRARRSARAATACSATPPGVERGRSGRSGGIRAHGVERRRLHVRDRKPDLVVLDADRAQQSQILADDVPALVVVTPRSRRAARSSRAGAGSRTRRPAPRRTRAQARQISAVPADRSRRRSRRAAARDARSSMRRASDCSSGTVRSIGGQQFDDVAVLRVHQPVDARRPGAPGASPRPPGAHARDPPTRRAGR